VDDHGVAAATDSTAGGTGTYTLAINVSDKTSGNPFRAQDVLTFNIDNRYPEGTFTGTAPANVTGSAYSVQGTAGDQDNVNGIGGVGKVLVYFTRNGSPVSLKEAGGVSSVAGGTLRVKDMTDSGKLKTINIPSALPSDQSAIVIDRNETSDSDGDGYVENFVDDAGEKRWAVRFDTTQLLGGKVAAHYIVYDEAGNAAHYAQDLTIRNHPPIVTGITVSTKAADGAVLSSPEYSGSYSATGFTVKNSHLVFKIRTSLGNRKMNYRITYLNSAAPVVASTALAAGNVYEIVSAGTTNWAAAGAPGGAVGTVFVAAGSVSGTGTARNFAGNTVSSPVKTLAGVTIPAGGTLISDIPAYTDFTQIADTAAANGARFAVKIWDEVISGGPETDQLYSLVVVGMNVDNVDNSAPVMTLYNLNPNGIREVGANEGATIQAAATPAAVGANQTRGGLYNKGSYGIPVWSGHIEPAKTTGIPGLSGMTNFDRDTVSGTVILRGRAFDTHRVTQISVKTGGDADLIILGKKAADDGTLEPKNSAKAYYTEEYALAGHTVEWAYVWDTEVKPSGLIIGDNQSIQATARDNQASPAAASASRAVDIRPFIQDLVRTGTNYRNNRSTQGWFSAAQNETLAMKGYNLYNGGARVLSIAGDAATAAGSPNIHELQFSIGAAKGGEMVLISGGFEAVNNAAGKTRVRAWNKENSSVPGSNLWDDGRYIHIWEPETGYFSTSYSAWEISTVAKLNGSTTELYGSWAGRDYQNVAAKKVGDGIGDFTIQLHGNDNFYDTDIALSSTHGVMLSAVLYNGVATGAVDSFGDGVGLLVAGQTSMPANTGASDLLVNRGSGYNVLGNAFSMSTTFRRDDRFQRPRLAADGATIYTSFYDKYSHSLRVHSVGNQSSNTGAYYDGRVTKLTVEGSSSNEPVNDPIADVGSWNAIDVGTFNGATQPVVAYYDATRDTVRMAIRNGSSWLRGDVLAASDIYHGGSGTYVNMKIDRSKTPNVVHLAFFNTSETAVIYATGTIPASHTDGNSFNFTSALVDAGVNGGRWADISLDTGGNPWIVYQDLSRPGGTDGARVAFKHSRYTKPAYDYNGKVITGWEALSMATAGHMVREDERLNIENSLGSADTWRAAVGYKSNDSESFRVCYYVNVAGNPVLLTEQP
jgi:hypothetical protein